LEVSFHLDEIEAKIYGFLKNDANRAFTLFEIYLHVFVDETSREEFRNNLSGEDYLDHPLYQNIRERVEMIVKEGKIASYFIRGVRSS